MAEIDWDGYIGANVAIIAALIVSGVLKVQIHGHSLQIKRPDLERLIVEGRLPRLGKENTG
jgi:hypothetical protein